MQRTKTTIACESCRKRKGKCSGTAPCTACQKNNFICEFQTNRQRRGPRRKGSSVGWKATLCTPQNPSLAQDTNHHGSPLAEGQLSPDSMVAEAHVSEAASFLMPTWSSCRDDLNAIIDIDELQILIPRQNHKDMLLDIMCHLIELFWTHVHNQQCPILNSRDFYQSIKARVCPDFLCLAICAASSRFSSHPLVRQVSGTVTIDECFALEARTRLYGELGSQSLPCIQSLCVLILFDAATGRGTQAWADNAVARGAIEATLTLKDLPSEVCQSLAMAQHFLIVHRSLQVLGYPSLAELCKEKQPSLAGGQESLNSQTIYLLRLLLRTREYSDGDATKTLLPPWNSQSVFLSIWRELETFRVRNPAGVISFSRFSLKEINSPSNETAVSLLIALIWHCSVIILHRFCLTHAFTWVELMAKTPSEQSDQAFNGVPIPSSSFWKEHINICMNSVAAVAQICAQIIRREVFLLPPFLAYTCFQSAIVLINFLRSPSPPMAGQLQQILEINLAMLSISEEFYAPASEWIKALKALQRVPTLSETGSPSLRQRYQILEPAFLPIDVTVSAPRNNMTFTSHISTRKSNHGQVSQDNRHTPDAFENDSQSLLRDYQYMLEEDLQRDATESILNRPPGFISTSNATTEHSFRHFSSQPSPSSNNYIMESNNLSQTDMFLPNQGAFISSVTAELPIQGIPAASNAVLPGDGSTSDFSTELDKLTFTTDDRMSGPSAETRSLDMPFLGYIIPESVISVEEVDLDGVQLGIPQFISSLSWRQSLDDDNT